MKAGAVIVCESIGADALQILEAPPPETRLFFECLAGGDGGAFQQARAHFKALTALVAGRLGRPDLTPTRAQGVAPEPPMIDPAWCAAAVWRLPSDHDGGRLIAVLAGGPRRAATLALHLTEKRR